jgi:hypothetical protein
LLQLQFLCFCKILLLYCSLAGQVLVHKWFPVLPNTFLVVQIILILTC